MNAPDFFGLLDEGEPDFFSGLEDQNEQPLQAKQSTQQTKDFFSEIPDFFSGIEEQEEQIATPKQQSLFQSFEQGLKRSASGELAQKVFSSPEIQEEIVQNPTFWESLAHSSGEITGDLPYMLAGGALGSALGGTLGSAAGPIGALTGGVAGGAFGAMAMPTFLKEALREYNDYRSKGNDITFGEFLNRADRVASKTLKEGAFGIILGSINKAMPLLQKIPGIGQLFTSKPAQKAAGIAAETGAIATIPALTEGRIPEAKDYAHALALVLGFNLAHLPAEIRDRVQKQGEASGLAPKEFAQSLPPEEISLINRSVKDITGEAPEAVKEKASEVLEKFPRKMESAREEHIAEQRAKEAEAEEKITVPIKEKIEAKAEKQKEVIQGRKQEVSKTEEAFEKKREALKEKSAEIDLEADTKLEKIAEKEKALTSKFEQQKEIEIEKLRRSSEKETNAKTRGIEKSISFLERDIDKRRSKTTKEIEAVERQIEKAKGQNKQTKRLENMKDSIQSKADKSIESLQNAIDKQQNRLDLIRDKANAELERKIDKISGKELPSSAKTPLEKEINTLEREIAKKKKLIADSEKQLVREKNQKIEGIKKEAEGKLRSLEKKKTELDIKQAERLKAQREKAYAERHPHIKVTPEKKSLPSIRTQIAGEMIETTGKGAAERIEYPATGAHKIIDKMNKFIQAAKTPKESLKRLGEATNEAVFNSLAPLEKLETEIPIPERASTRIKLAQTAASEINSVFENGIFSNVTGKFEHGGLQDAYGDLSWKKITKNLKPHEYSLQELDAYRVSKAALKRQAEGKKTGVDTKEAIKDINRLKDKYGPIDDRIREFQKATLVTYGKDLLGKDLIAQWNKDYYAPLFRVMEEGKDSILASGSLTPKQPFKKMVGSERKIIPPSESDTYNSSMLIRNARKNDAILQYRKLVLEGKLPGKVKTGKVDPIPALVLDELGIDSDMKKLAETLYNQTRKEAFTPEKNTLRGWKDGKPFDIEVPSEIYNVFSTLAPQDRSPLARIFSFTNRLFSRGITMEPRKFASIMSRDALSSLIYSRTGSNPISVVEALGDIYGESQVYKEFLSMGGDVYASRLAERIDRSKKIEDLITPGKEGILVPFEKIGDYFRKYSETLGDISLAVPLAEYKRAIAKYGNTPEGRIMAAMEARRVVYDPTRKGGSKIVREMGNFIPFWNVSLQDMSMVGKNLKNPETWAKGIAAISIPTLLLKMANEGNPDYQDLTPVDKAAFWHVYFGDKHLRIPIPWLLGTAFKVSAETFYDTVQGLTVKGDDRAKHAWEGLYHNLTENVSGTLPPFASAYIEQATGKSPKSPLGAFLGAKSRAPDVVPRRLEGLPPKFQYTSKTSQLARWFGDYWNISPVKLERLVKGFGGNVAADLLALTDEMAYYTGMAEDKRPEQREANYLLLGNFVSTSPSRTKYAEEFYEYLNEASQNKKAHELIRKNGLDKSLEEISYRNVPLGRYQRDINKIFRDMRTIEDSNRFTPSEKKERLDEMQRIINEKYKLAVERVREAKVQK